MAHRIQHRRGNGRYRQASLETDFGLRTIICTCLQVIPYKLNEGKPKYCHRCGQLLNGDVTPPAASDAAHQG